LPAGRAPGTGLLPPRRFPNTRLGKHCVSLGSAASAGCSRLGREGSGGTAKLNAEVMSPTVLFRQALMLGTGTLNRLEMNFSVEVWSKTSLTLVGPGCAEK
jgi:hypothetical protein